MDASNTKYITLGILAHVDSGKTTLSEGLLYTAGMLLKLGRVDHKNAFLDTDALERERGITIFSKQARIVLKDASGKERTVMDLLDTPGHMDFSAEMERTLQVLDYAVLVISGTSGIQSHTETLWRLLEHSGIPVFLFINKMDLAYQSRQELMELLQSKLHPACVDFTQQDETFWEAVGACDEQLMEQVLEQGTGSDADIAEAIRHRQIFPCLFGSALKMEGVSEFLELLDRYTLQSPASEAFGAKVFKITEDEQGSRLTHLKLTGGILNARDQIEYTAQDGSLRQEKISQLRLYSGKKFIQPKEIYPGMVCAVTGLSGTFAGLGLGMEKNAENPVLEPILRYTVALSEDCNFRTGLEALRKLEEEDPMLQVSFQEQIREIHILLMGEIQLAVLQHQLLERFGIHAEFLPAGVAYKETIADTVEGCGHYEPLRHYAEVRLLLEPGKPGSGLKFSSVCREDALDRNWQRLILTHLAEKTHLGVLTGSPVTDMKITLTAGRAHKKHTEGGDFRQATYRAVRQGLMQAESVLLEPWYHFRLEVPADSIGRAISDLQLCGGKLNPPETLGETALLTGKAPALYLMTYRSDMTAYTRGRGKLSFTPAGYAPCAEPDKVIAAAAYQAESDLDNSPHSIFCSHGAGNLVKWQDVPSYMHTESYIRQEAAQAYTPAAPQPSVRSSYSGSIEQDKELMAIFERTYGAIRRDTRDDRHILHTEKQEPSAKRKAAPIPKGPEYLLVDGYNIIFAWDELKRIAAENLDAARERLIHILSNYQGFRKNHVILVFDAYRVKGNLGSTETIGGINIVYTKEAETADTYIERVSHVLGKEHRVRVATSDGMEQIIILGNGAYRVSAEELRIEIADTNRQIQEIIRGSRK